MPGEILQTVGERMVFHCGAYTGSCITLVSPVLVYVYADQLLLTMAAE